MSEPSAPRVTYGDKDEPDGDLVFIRVCPNCGRFVKPDKIVKNIDENGKFEPNATCSKCGRVNMLFEGYF